MAHTWLLLCMLSLPILSFSQAESRNIEQKDTLNKTIHRSFQFGLQIGSENYPRGPFNRRHRWDTHKGIWTVELSAEYDLVNWLKVHTAIGWERHSIDYGYYNIERWDEFSYGNLRHFIEEYDIDFPTDRPRETSYKIKHVTSYLVLPVGFRFFNSPLGKKTRLWAGGEFRQYLYVNYRFKYRLRLEAERERGAAEEFSSSFYGQGYRLMMGADRQIKSSLRARVHLHFTRSYDYWNRNYKAFYSRYGISLSLLWSRHRDKSIS